MEEIFKDLVVIELASVLAGPAVGMFFSELGAKVIKIENAKSGGDITRQWKTSQENADAPSSNYYYAVNYKKESLFLDLKDEKDYQKVKAYISKADIVISNFRIQSAEKLKLDAKTLCSEFPGLIYGQINAYDENDNRPGFDALMQAETGWMNLNGQSDGPATKMPVALIDILSAHQLKEGILIALIKKAQTGKGAIINVSLYDTALSALANQASSFLNSGITPKRKGSQHPSIAPYGDILTSKDDQSILLAVGNDKQFTELCRVLDSEALGMHALFNTNALRVSNRELLLQELGTAMKNYTAQYLIEEFEKHSVPASVINNLKSVFENPAAQKMILTEEQNGIQTKRVKTIAFKISD